MDGMTVGIVTMEHDAPHGGEVHPDGDEVLYVISGGVSVTSDSNPGETLELGPEDRANSRAFYSKGGLSATLNPSGGWELGRSRRREIRRRTRRKFSPEEKVRIVLEGLRGEQSVSELCRREDIAANLYSRWSKDSLEAGKKQLAGDTVREATSDEVKGLRSENRELKEVVAEITLANRVLKKSLVGHGEEDGT
jgi:transposase